MTTQKPKRVEMPDGTSRHYHAKTVRELKEQVSVSIGVEEDELALITEDGTPLAQNEETIPQALRVVPKPKWGAAL